MTLYRDKVEQDDSSDAFESAGHCNSCAEQSVSRFLAPDDYDPQMVELLVCGDAPH